MTEITRKLRVSEQTFYRWKQKYAGLGMANLMIVRLVVWQTPPWMVECRHVVG